MKQRMACSGTTARQEKIIDARRLMSEELMKDPSYQEFVIWEFGVLPEDFVEQPIKLYNRRYSSASGFTTQYETLWDKAIPVGTVLYDKKRNEYQLCTESFDKDEILNNGKLTRCNGWLKWQNKEGKVYEYPIFDINSTQYNSGVESSKIMVLGSTQHMLSITADENTISLRHDMRFFLDRNKVEPTVFKLTQNDTTAMNYDKGILHLTVTEDQYNPDTDNIDEWLCDYVKPPVQSDIEIEYMGNPNVRIGGSYKIFTAVSLTPVTWDIIAKNDIKNQLIITTIPAENKCKIKCNLEESLIGKSFTLQCTDSNGNIASVLVEIVGGV